MLRNAKEDRTLKENLMLASSTAFVAGFVNVAGVVAFLSFTANITGHVANLAKHMVANNLHEVILFFIWLLLFFSGAFISNFLVRSQMDKSNYSANAAPLIVEIILLLSVAVYGHQFYRETQTEREIVVGAIILSMGLQNGLVSNISGGLIKTSHLTGLFTDLGSDVAEWLHPKTAKTLAVKNKIYIRLTILSFYLIGGITGGWLFDQYDFAVFYLVPLILLTILYYDLSPLALHKLAKILTRSKDQ